MKLSLTKGGVSTSDRRGYTPQSSKIGDAAPLHIAMVIQRLRPYFSGQGIQVEGLCRELGRRGIKTTIVTAVDGSSPPLEEIDRCRIRRLRCDLPMVGIGGPKSHLWSPVFGLRTLAYLQQCRGFDLVHVHAMTDALYTSWLWSRLRGVPLLFEMTLMGEDDPLTIKQSNNLFGNSRYAIFSRCDGYVAISPALAEKYEEAKLPSEKLRIVPQGVDVEEFNPVNDRIALRRQLGLPLEGPLLIFIGSLIHRKGFDLLLKAWSRVHSKYPDSHLVLVGKNKFEEGFEASQFMASQLSGVSGSASENLHLLGTRECVSQYLQAADVFLFPSRREGFGTVIVEAMACSLPCVVAKLPGITDFIFSSSGDDGVVVPQDDSLALAIAVEELITDPNRARAIGRRARQRTLERFSFTKIADSYIDFYSTLIRSRGGTLNV